MNISCFVNATETYFFYKTIFVKWLHISIITRLHSHANTLNSKLLIPETWQIISGRMVEHWTVNRGDGGSIPPTTLSKLRLFRSPHICVCLSEETLKAGGPFCLVSMPGEVKDPTQGVNV